MKLRENASESHVRINEVIAEVEESYFIGRNDEVKFFHDYVQEENPAQKIIYIYGEGGIGKTFLLHEFSRIAARQDILYIQLDSQDFRHTTQEFVDYFYNIIISHINPQEKYASKATLRECLDIINRYGKRLILVMDTYEQMDDLDRWFRNAVLRQLHPRISIILAGRKRLSGDWIESPAWRKITKQIKLEPFSFTDTFHFLRANGHESKEETAKTIWEFTNGNPLLLTLATISEFKEDGKQNYPSNNFEILQTLTNRWLNEVQNECLINIIEVAALFHQFDQNNISEVLKQEVSNMQFHQLTSLSFIQKTQNGWAFHQLIRDALRVELQQRNPERYDYLTERIIDYYYQRIKKKPKVNDIASFFYHIGNDFLQSVFFQDSIMDTSMYLEPVGEYNFHEVEEYIEYQKANIIPSSTSYYNRTTNKSYHFDASIEHNRREIELISTDYIKKIGYEGTNLLKNSQGDNIGLSVIVPIHEKTLTHLANAPVSRAYFSTLSQSEIRLYQSPSDKPVGYFIRSLDYKDPSNRSARSFLLHSLFPLMFYGGKIITSTPLTMFQDILYMLGFKVVEGATHYDYEPDVASPTFILDLTGPNLIPYLTQFLDKFKKKNEVDILTEKFSLTKREQDIMRLVLEEKHIAEIANELYIAEITVKKSLSRIYQKANVKNRVQLIKRIMELL